jgi:SPP1 gp7 family putative phage head morphogenesis protein
MPEITPAILINAFDLTPERAIAYLAKKGFRITGSAADLLGEEHARAFTVARVAKADLLQAIRDRIVRALADGTPIAEFTRSMLSTATPEDLGEETKRDLARRIRTIFRTNSQSALMVGRYHRIKEVSNDRPWWQYVAVMDSRTRPEHARLNGKVFRHDDPFWRSFWPPNGYNCRCAARTLSDADLRRAGITPESSAGNIETREVSVGSGERARATTITGYRTEKGTVWCDPGFDTNQAEAAWTPDPRRHDPDIAARLAEDLR